MYLAYEKAVLTLKERYQACCWEKFYKELPFGPDIKDSQIGNRRRVYCDECATQMNFTDKEVLRLGRSL